MAVLDKSLNAIDTDDESTKSLEEYIRYMAESIEFSMGKTAGRTELNVLDNRVTALEHKYTELEARVKALENK